MLVNAPWLAEPSATVSTDIPALPILDAQQARLLHLSAQGLLAAPRRRARQGDVLAAIERMRLLQIDTIHVVARSPYLVLFSRLGDYRPEWLDAALADAAIFECWSHEACFAPASDFALHRSARDTRGHHWSMKHAQRMAREQAEPMQRLVDHVRANGAVKAADFERTQGRASAWWGWKDEKRWLEAAFALGHLMIARRENFHRVYDLPERVIGRVQPDWDREPLPAAEVRQRQIAAAVKALGIARAAWIADYYRSGRRYRDADLDEPVERGELVRVEVDGWDAAGYVHRDLEADLRRAQAGRLRASHTTLLSPFDPVVWDRTRAGELFGFDYRLECYTPAEKRRFGYFVLPILQRGRLVGRLDAKAHRAEGLFEVKSVHLEPDVVPDATLLADLGRALRTCAAWHRTPRIVVRRSDPRDFAKRLRAELAASA